jgi:hypothetical protein
VDLLNRIYSNHVPEKVRSQAEYTHYDVDEASWSAKVGARAETGHAETGFKFARRLKDIFILLRPGVDCDLSEYVLLKLTILARFSSYEFLG